MEKNVQTGWLLEMTWDMTPMWWGTDDWTEVRGEGRVFTTEQESLDFGWDEGLDDVYSVPL